ncbi:1559_t:CDS:2, partial [Ambispora leptoticha]
EGGIEGETTGKSAGKKSLDGGASRNNGKISGGAEKSRKNNDNQLELGNNNRVNTGGKIAFSNNQQPPTSSGYDPLTGHEGSQQALRRSTPPEIYNNQNLTRELKKIEDSLTNKIGKMFGKEMEKQYQRLEEERNAHQVAETERQEAILQMVSKSLTNNTSKLLESTIRSEIQSQVVPMLNKSVAASVDKQVNRGMVEAINKSIPAAIDKAVTENVQRVLSKSSVIDSIAKSVSKSMRPVIEEIFRENFTNMLIPSYEKATNAMFDQIHRTFNTGLQQITQKSSQSGSSVDANAIARLQASIDQLTVSMSQLQQVQQLQASMQANLISQLTAPHTDQQQTARSLSGELKRILIPGPSQSSGITQEPYNYPS